MVKRVDFHDSSWRIINIDEYLDPWMSPTHVVIHGDPCISIKGHQYQPTFRLGIHFDCKLQYHCNLEALSL